MHLFEAALSVLILQQPYKVKYQYYSHFTDKEI